MPSLGVYFPKDESDAVINAAKISEQSESAYIADAVRERMRREGHVPGNPAFDIRAEALSTAEVVGAETVIRSLRRLRSKNAAKSAA